MDVEIRKLDGQPKPLGKRESGVGRVGLQFEHPVPDAFDRQPRGDFAGQRPAHPVSNCQYRSIVTLRLAYWFLEVGPGRSLGSPGISGRKIQSEEIVFIARAYQPNVSL